MSPSGLSGAGQPPVEGRYTAAESSQSAVSWAAIIAGAFAAVSITLVLLALGAGLGLASISPWSGSGASATTFTIGAGFGLIVVQWLSSGLGGYITGRLRANWVGVHSHEAFFRDTAHGFLMWALATVVGTVVLASAASSLIGGGVHAAAAAASGAGQAVAQVASSVSPYDVDSLFRSDHPDANASPQATTAQASRILANSMATGTLSANDRNYLSRLVAARTGISQDDAQKRIDAVVAREKEAVAKAKQIADEARKSTAEFAIFTALSMMIGAFVASAAAAFGGSPRDVR